MLITNTDIYVFLYIIVAAVFVRTSCVFLIYLFIAMNYSRNIFFYFERKNKKYRTPWIVKRILSPFNYINDQAPKTQEGPPQLLGDPDTTSQLSQLQPLKSSLSKKSMFSLINQLSDHFTNFRNNESEFIIKVNKLETCYLFYKQIEYQRLLLFNIFFGTFYIAVSKVIILFQDKSNKTGFGGPSMSFLFQFFGFDTTESGFGNSVNLFVFLNMVFLIINKIAIKNMSINKRLHTGKNISKLYSQIDPQKRGLLDLTQEAPPDIPELSAEHLTLEEPSESETAKSAAETDEEDEIFENPGSRQFKEYQKDLKKQTKGKFSAGYDENQYRDKAQILKYYSVHLMWMRMFRFCINFLSYVLLLILLFLNIFNENIFTILFLFLILFGSNSERQRKWILFLLILKIIIVYASYLIFFDGVSLDRKNTSVTLFSLFIKADWVRLILYQVIIGQDFKLSYFFVECIFILFFVFSQKIQMFFNKVLTEYLQKSKQKKFDDFAEKLCLGSLRADSALPQINILPCVADFCYTFYVNNIYSFLFGFSLFFVLFFRFDVINSLWVLISFALFIYFELLWDYRKLTKKQDLKRYMRIYARSTGVLLWVFNLVLLVLQVGRFLVSRIPFFEWLDKHMSNFTYLMIIFFIIILQNEIIRHQKFKKSFKAYNFFRKVRKKISIRLKVHESFIEKIYNIMYRLMLEENKRSNLQKVFQIIDHKIKQKQLKKREKNDTEAKVIDKLQKTMRINYRGRELNLKPDEISLSDEVIHVYSTGLLDILRIKVELNKYFYFNFLEQIEYMLEEYNISLSCLQKYNLLCDFVQTKLFDNPAIKELIYDLNVDPQYIRTDQIQSKLDKNIFNLKSSRQYLDEQPSIFFVVKRWLFYWGVMNLDFICKLVIILLCTLDASLMMKLPVAYFVFIDLCLTVSNTNYSIVFFFLIGMYFLKVISYSILSNLDNSYSSKVSSGVVHSFVGDFATQKTVMSLLLMVFIYVIDLYKAKDGFFKYYIKHNIFTIFNKIYVKKATMRNIISRFFHIEEEERDVKDKRIMFYFFKVKLVYYFSCAKKRMYKFIKNRYLFNKNMGPNFLNIEENIFHPYLFKSGIELYSLIIVTQLLFALYNILCWDNLFTNSATLLESISTSELKGSLVIFILVVSACMLIDAILINTNSGDYNKIQRFIELPEDKLRPFLRLKRFVMKIINLNRIRKKKVVLRKDYNQRVIDRVGEEFSRKNPTFPKFGFTILVWLVYNLYLWGMLFRKQIHLAQNSNLPILDFITSMHNTDNIYVLGSELIFLVYTIFSIIFIRYGIKMKQFYKSNQLSEFGILVMEKLNAVPYFRELRVFLFWTARKTSLEYKDWFTIDYCYFQMMERFEMDYESREEIEVRPKWEKLLFGLGPLVLIFLILLGPLFLFSSFNPINMPNTISSVNVDFSLEIENFGIFKLYSLGECPLPSNPETTLKT